MPDGFRWRLVVRGEDAAADPRGQLPLFDADELVERHVGRGEYRGLEFLHVNCRSIINRIPDRSPMPFDYTINAYRGCSHACVYCFARPTHEYLGLGIGEDFDRRIVVKVNAVERLQAALAPRRWPGHPIAMGTNTDPYQRAEGKYHLTQGMIRLLVEAANPFSILTKSTLILRDVELLAEAVRRTTLHVNVSIGTLDEDVWRLTEPGTPHPQLRMDAVARLNEAGVPCGVVMGPIIPGLSDGQEQLAAVVGAAVEAGATSITPIALHLRSGIRSHVLTSLGASRPDVAADLAARYRRAYLPADSRRALSRRVRELVDAARARRRQGCRPGGGQASSTVSRSTEKPFSAASASSRMSSASNASSTSMSGRSRVAVGLRYQRPSSSTTSKPASTSSRSASPPNTPSSLSSTSSVSGSSATEVSVDVSMPASARNSSASSAHSSSCSPCASTVTQPSANATDAVSPSASIVTAIDDGTTVARDPSRSTSYSEESTRNENPDSARSSSSEAWASSRNIGP
jgi:DNA repair photolyase